MKAVLVVTQQPVPAELEALRQAGHTLAVVTDATAALERLHHDTPDVVLVDLDAPIADARAFLAAWLAGWRRGLRWARVPVAALARRDGSVLDAVEHASRPGPLLGFAA